MTFLTTRPATPEDVAALRDFFGRTPARDRTFFREDVLAADVLKDWFGRGREQVVVVDGDRVVACLSLLPGVEWSQHVVELRLVVEPTHRRQGLGRALARRGLLEAIERGFTKVVVEVVADQDETLALFSQLGFEAEGLLREHVRGLDGEVHDLLVLAHAIDRGAQAAAATGLDELVGAGS